MVDRTTNPEWQRQHRVLHDLAAIHSRKQILATGLPCDNRASKYRIATPHLQPVDISRPSPLALESKNKMKRIDLEKRTFSGRCCKLPCECRDKLHPIIHDRETVEDFHIGCIICGKVMVACLAWASCRKTSKESMALCHTCIWPALHLYSALARNFMPENQQKDWLP
jgi:hypothetical protein